MAMKWPEVRHPRNRPQRVYIRFGRWSARSYNHFTGEKELGVSVYPASFAEDGSVVLSDEYEYPVHLLEGRVCFPVTGDEVGIGSDGEPVLRRVKALPYAIHVPALPCGYGPPY